MNEWKGILIKYNKYVAFLFSNNKIKLIWTIIYNHMMKTLTPNINLKAKK
jgi:hypothetical protein